MAETLEPILDTHALAYDRADRKTTHEDQGCVGAKRGRPQIIQPVNGHRSAYDYHRKTDRREGDATEPLAYQPTEDKPYYGAYENCSDVDYDAYTGHRSPINYGKETEMMVEVSLSRRCRRPERPLPGDP